MQSGRPSTSLTDAQIVDLAHWLRQRVNETLRSSPTFTVQDILTGNAAAGAAYFNGDGKCATCHTAASHSLVGIATRIPNPVDVQQRMLFPGTARGRGSGPASGPSPTAVTVTVTPPSGPAMSGVLVALDDFYVTFRDASDAVRVVKITAGTKVEKHDPMQAHHDLLDRITDKQIHDVVAYLVTLK